MSVRVGTLRQRLLAGVLACAALMYAGQARAQGSPPARAQDSAAVHPDSAVTDTTPPRYHVVKRRDTLWDLSQLYLGSPWIWPRIYKLNTQQVRDPHWIYPGQKLRIPTAEEVARVLAQAPVEEEAGPGDRTRFYDKSAPGPTGPTFEAAAGSAARPGVERWEFLAAPWIEDEVTLPVMGHMLDRVTVAAGADRLPQLALVQDRLYIRLDKDAPITPGTELQIVRVDRKLPGLGDVIEPTAVVRVEQVHDGVAVARLTRQYGMVLQGQHVLPLPAFSAPVGQAQPVERGAEARLVAFLHDQPLHTTADIAFVGLGKSDGLQIGDELVAYAPARRSPSDPTAELPPEDVGRLRVVRVAEHTATARVLGLRQTALQPGLAVRLVARVR